MGTADPRAQKSRAPSGTCRNHGSTKRMDAQSTGLDRYSERKERGELEWDCAGMHAGGRYTRSNALLIAYGAPVPCGHVSSIVKINVFSLLARRRRENFGFFTHPKQNFRIFRDFLKKI